MPVNIYGFKRHAAEEYDKAAKALTCSICHVALIGDSSDALSMICPRCGTRVLEQDAQHNLELKAKFTNSSNRPKIMQGRSRKKVYSEQGDLLPADDELIQQEISEGKKIISYKEQLPDESKLPSYRPTKKKWLT